MATEAQGSDPVAENRARLLTVLGAVASGVGVIGFVTVVGGAVLWIRFNAVAVPADKAVAAIPTGELVSLGLSTLIPFIALGLGAVFLAYLFAADNIVPTVPAGDARWTGESAAAAVPPEQSPGEGGQAALSALAREAQSAVDAIHSEAAVIAAAARIGSEDLAKEHYAKAEEAFKKAQQLVPQAAGSLSDASIDPAHLLAEAEASLQQAERAKDAAAGEAKRRSFGVRVRVVGASLILMLLEMALVVASQVPTFIHFLLLAGLGFVLALATVVVGWRSRGFALFGASIFIAVLLFGTVRTLVRTQDYPKLQPVALLRTGPDRGVVGYYIAETSDRVYLARVESQQVLQGASFAQSLPRIIIVPRSSVAAIAIGPLTEPKAALTEGAQLFKELCREKVAETPSQTTTTSRHKKPLSKNPCPPS